MRESLRSEFERAERFARRTKVAEDAVRLVRLVEKDMSDAASKAWRSADARRGLSDHEALLVYADALTRWSERFRMALDGDDYREGER